MLDTLFLLIEKPNTNKIPENIYIMIENLFLALIRIFFNNL